MFRAPSNTPWDEDGIEQGEQCWRLDVARNVEFQLFAKTDDGINYHNPRLFYEQDVRIALGEFRRTRYACDQFDVTDTEAVALLSIDGKQANTILADLLDEIDRLPNLPEYCNDHPEFQAIT